MLLSYLLLLCCTALCWADESEWNWLCDPVSAQEGVQVEDLIGSYIAVESIPGQGENGAKECGFVNIERTNDSSILQYQETRNKGAADEHILLMTMTLVTPSRWLLGESGGNKAPVVVVDLPADRSSLAVSICVLNPLNIKQTTTVFGRSANVALGPINERLLRAGVRGVEDAHLLDTTDCSSPN